MTQEYEIVHVETGEIVGYTWADEGEWVHDIQMDVEALRLRGWRLADKVRSGIDQFGTGKQKVSDLYDVLADHTGLTRKTLKNLASVAVKFPEDKRHSLSVSHHVAVLGLDEEHADYLLSEAENKHMGVRALTRAAHGPVGPGDGTEGADFSEEPDAAGDLDVEDEVRAEFDWLRNELLAVLQPSKRWYVQRFAELARMVSGIPDGGEAEE